MHHVFRVLFFGCIYTLFKVSAAKNQGAMSLPKSRQPVCLSVVVSLSQGAVHTLTNIFSQMFNNMQFFHESIGHKCQPLLL